MEPCYHVLRLFGFLLAVFLVSGQRNPVTVQYFIGQNLKGELLMIDALRSFLPDNTAVTLKNCELACKRTAGCNGFVYCASPTGCGMGCRNYSANTDARAKGTLGSNARPVRSAGPQMDLCHEDGNTLQQDSYRQGVCSLKYLTRPARPAFWPRTVPNGWITGVVRYPPQCSGIEMSACEVCYNQPPLTAATSDERNTTGCIACAQTVKAAQQDYLLPRWLPGDDSMVEQERCVNTSFNPTTLPEAAGVVTAPAANGTLQAPGAPQAQGSPAPKAKSKDGSNRMLFIIIGAAAVGLIGVIVAVVFVCCRYGRQLSPPVMAAGAGAPGDSKDLENAPGSKGPQSPGANLFDDEKAEYIRQEQSASDTIQTRDVVLAGTPTTESTRVVGASADQSLTSANSSTSLPGSPFVVGGSTTPSRTTSATVDLQFSSRTSSRTSSLTSDLGRRGSINQAGSKGYSGTVQSRESARGDPNAIRLSDGAAVTLGSQLPSTASQPHQAVGASGVSGSSMRSSAGSGTASTGELMVLGLALPRCLALITTIMTSGERVVANNARCSHLVHRIAAMRPLLEDLPQRMQTKGTSNRDLERLRPLFTNIEEVLVEVKECIGRWCSDNKLGSAATVLRNMVASAWYQEGFLELNSKLSYVLNDLNIALNIQQQGERGINQAALEAQARADTEKDLQGLVLGLVAEDESGHDKWSTLADQDKQTLQKIFKHHKLDLSKTVKQARTEAMDRKVQHLLIPSKDISLLRPLGQGGYGAVMEGVWRKTVPVAIKKLHVGTLTDRARMELKKEAYIHSSVDNHPNVCKVYGLVLEEPCHCALVMELHKRGNLLLLLHDDNVVMSWRQKLSIALDAANGMAHLHMRSIVHGDLKPANLLLRDDGRAVVTDFGLSSISSVTLASASVSAFRAAEGDVDPSRSGGGLTLWYTSPEMLANNGVGKSQMSDVYAFGIVLWEIATRQVPYETADYEFIARVVLRGARPRVPTDIPEPYVKLMRSCWSQKPEDRPNFETVVERLVEMIENLGGEEEEEEEGKPKAINAYNLKTVKEAVKGRKMPRANTM